MVSPVLPFPSVNARALLVKTPSYPPSSSLLRSISRLTVQGTAFRHHGFKLITAQAEGKPVQRFEAGKEYVPVVALRGALVGFLASAVAVSGLIGSPSQMPALADEFGREAYLELLENRKVQEEAPAPGELTPEERARQFAEQLKKKREEAVRAEAERRAAEDAARAAKEKEKEEALAAAAAAKSARSSKSDQQQEAASGAPAAAAVKKSSSRGSMPLFLAQFLLLLGFSGGVSAVLLVPESTWKQAKVAVDGVLAKAQPYVDQAVEKATPFAQQALAKAKEVSEQVQPMVLKAVETATPVIADGTQKLVEAAKPLAAKAVDAAKPLLSQAQEKANKVIEKAKEKVSAK
eukprot:TRINITY_DN33_c0_g1_i2.p1 TRINITY_DN33_c0_g1~~TRINITY_DN33_c0_g1_i2.p1  ORF type:complete len:397 (-),score=153.36 TRINITY_DN33_c0_g1_i2:32-1078(-)